MSEDQFALLFRGPGSQRAAKTRVAGPRKRREDLPENILESQVCGLLAARGWVLIRQHVRTVVDWHQLAGKDVVKVSALRPSRIGSKGDSDWIAVRPIIGQPRGAAHLFYFETKAPGRKPSTEQRLYLERRLACGFLAAWFDDYDGDWDTSFLPWYGRHFPGEIHT
jgi:hypothetical protein